MKVAPDSSPLTVWYKRSAGLEAPAFNFAEMFVNNSQVQINHFRPHYAYTMLVADVLVIR